MSLLLNRNWRQGDQGWLQNPKWWHNMNLCNCIIVVSKVFPLDPPVHARHWATPPNPSVSFSWVGCPELAVHWEVETVQIISLFPVMGKANYRILGKVFLKSKERSAEKDPCTLCAANWKDSIRWGWLTWKGSTACSVASRPSASDLQEMRGCQTKAQLWYNGSMNQSLVYSYWKKQAKPGTVPRMALWYFILLKDARFRH